MRVLHMCAHVCVSSRVSIRSVSVQPRYGASIHSVSEHEVVRTTGTGVGRISPACVVRQTKQTRTSCVCVLLLSACGIGPVSFACAHRCVCFRVCLSLVVDACYVSRLCVRVCA